MDENTKGMYINLAQEDYEKLTQIATQNNIALGAALSLLITKGYEVIQTEDDPERRYSVDKGYLLGTLASVGTSALWISQEIGILKNRLEKVDVQFSTLEPTQQQEDE